MTEMVIDNANIQDLHKALQVPTVENESRIQFTGMAPAAAEAAAGAIARVRCGLPPSQCLSLGGCLRRVPSPGPW